MERLHWGGRDLAPPSSAPPMAINRLSVIGCGWRGRGVARSGLDKGAASEHMLVWTVAFLTALNAERTRSEAR